VSASGGEEPPPWHELPDRTADPRIRRARRHRLAIALARRVTRGRSYAFLRVLAIDRRLFRPFLSLNARLMPFGKLERAQTEAVIMRTALLCGSRYEWVQHEALARRAGVSAAQIEAIRSDPESEALPEPTRLLLCAAAELLERHAIEDGTHERLAAHFSPAEILEATMLVGNYAMLAGALNSFGVRLEPAWER
jgi:alkylhydroperoxidase family enzyme